MHSAFFDPNTAAGNSGNFLTQTVIPALRNACGNKKIMITEYVSFYSTCICIIKLQYYRTGWPSRGGSNGAGVASLDNERAALAALNCASGSIPDVSVFAFEYDDQTWKGNDNERSFGIFPKFNNGVPSC